MCIESKLYKCNKLGISIILFYLNDFNYYSISEINMFGYNMNLNAFLSNKKLLLKIFDMYSQ